MKMKKEKEKMMGAGNGGVMSEEDDDNRYVYFDNDLDILNSLVLEQFHSFSLKTRFANFPYPISSPKISCTPHHV